MCGGPRFPSGFSTHPPEVVEVSVAPLRERARHTAAGGAASARLEPPERRIREKGTHRALENRGGQNLLLAKHPPMAREKRCRELEGTRMERALRAARLIAGASD